MAQTALPASVNLPSTKEMKEGYTAQIEWIGVDLQMIWSFPFIFAVKCNIFLFFMFLYVFKFLNFKLKQKVGMMQSPETVQDP